MDYAIKRFLKRLVFAGVDETVDHSEIKHIVVLNIIALVSLLFNCVYLPMLFRYLPESRIFLYFCISSLFLLPVVLILNHFKYHLAARIFFSLFGGYFIAIPILGGRSVSMHFFLIMIMISAFYIYPPRMKYIKYTVVLIAFASFVGLEAWLMNNEGVLSLSREFLKVGSFTINIVLILYLLGFLFYIYTIYLNAEKESENLLHNILPVKIANRLKSGQKKIADGFEACSVLFADIVNFTKISEHISPADLVTMLNEIFSSFDDYADRYGLEKIKTIGDAYMVAAGIPDYREDHAEAIAEFAIDIKEVIKGFVDASGKPLWLRIGINSGPVVAGVIGKKKFIYDLWGDTVNTASRMESHGVPDEIQLTQTTFLLIKDKYICTERGYIEVKGKGQMQTYFLKGRI